MTTKFVRRKLARHLDFVRSDSDPELEYEISALPDGALACACLSWNFNKDRPKRCKHLDAYGVEQIVEPIVTKIRSLPTIQRPVDSPRRVVTFQGETFRFRRAIGEI